MFFYLTFLEIKYFVSLISVSPLIVQYTAYVYRGLLIISPAEALELRQ